MDPHFQSILENGITIQDSRNEDWSSADASSITTNHRKRTRKRSLDYDAIEEKIDLIFQEWKRKILEDARQMEQFKDARIVKCLIECNKAQLMAHTYKRDQAKIESC